MLDLEELSRPFDPFADEFEEEEQTTNTVNDNTTQTIHLRIQQRNGRKTMTMLEGLPQQYNINKVVKALRKKCACIGTVMENDETGQTLKFSGDQRQKIAEFLIKEKIATKAEITIHGF